MNANKITTPNIIITSIRDTDANHLDLSEFGIAPLSLDCLSARRQAVHVLRGRIARNRNLELDPETRLSPLNF